MELDLEAEAALGVVSQAAEVEASAASMQEIQMTFSSRSILGRDNFR